MNFHTFVHEFQIDKLGNRKRRISVYVPETNNPCAVLYMHDGQNLVDEAPYSGYSWDIISTTSRLIDEGKIDPIIIVGIDNDSQCRIEEYSNDISNSAKKYFKDKEVLPEGEIFSDFIVKVIVPFVESHYSTIPSKRGVAGSSCGGNISYYMGARYPEVFEIIGAFSPAYHIIGRSFFQMIRKWNVGSTQRIYHDMGMKETKCFSVQYLFPLIKTNVILRRKLQNRNNIKMVIDPKASHTELFWQVRFEGFLMWAYQKIM
ncbi:MAG: alpha/beta hydrolase [Candidatus Izemoplasmatales bacterium]